MEKEEEDNMKEICLFLYRPKDSFFGGFTKGEMRQVRPRRLHALLECVFM